MNKIYKNTEYPIKEKNRYGTEQMFSVDVITCDDEGLLNLAFYDFKNKKWRFHTDTSTYCYEDNGLTDFVWMYKPEELTCNFI